MKQFFIFISIIACLCIIILFFYRANESLKIELSDSKANLKALLLENNSLDSTSRVLKLTIDQLEYSKDSISKRLNNIINTYNKSKSKITQLQYMLATNTKIDTLTIKDTIFVNNIHIDTCVTDNKWYSLNLALRSPNKIIVNPKFRNEFITMFSYKKETVDPPKKFFLCR